MYRIGKASNVLRFSMPEQMNMYACALMTCWDSEHLKNFTVSAWKTCFADRKQSIYIHLPTNYISWKLKITLLDRKFGQVMFKCVPKKVDTIQNWLKLSFLQTSIRVFEILQFFHLFILIFANLLPPFMTFSRKRSKIHEWNESCKHAV